MMLTQTQAPPYDAITAVTHPNPYPFYAELIGQKPFYFDGGLSMWVAASAEAVAGVLTSELCRVRPVTEPVPRALLDSAAADIFRHLVRMNDGETHRPFKRAISSTLSLFDPAQVSQQSQQWARLLLAELDVAASPVHLTDYIFRLPIYVVAGLLGIPQDKLPQTARWINDFVGCIAPGSSLEQIARGKAAAGELLNLLHSLLADPPMPDGLLLSLARTASDTGRDRPEVIVANAVGLLSQTYEATAGLLGNTLLALASQPDIYEQVILYPVLLHQIIQEVLRCDPPVQNTQRFVAQDGIVGGQTVKAGQVILVVLAAANRDAAANPNPDSFEIFRKNRKIFTFGMGVHACPGEILAASIVRAGIELLLGSELDFARLLENVTYRPSINTRIPLFH